MSLVRTEIDQRVAVVTLDDPKRRNAISLRMAEELEATFGSLEASPDVGAVVITGTPPAFSAGADLDDLEHATRESLGRIYRGFLAVARFPLPTIAAVNGPAVGAGLNLALCCDLRVAARRARFESRFLDLALHPGGGHTWMLRNLLGPQGAAALVLCNESLNGEEAVRRGMAWSCVDDEALPGEARRLATRCASAPRELLVRLKATLRDMAAVTGHAEAVERELEPQYWSVKQKAFLERLASLKRRISKKEGRP
jgi:enoyl-CoA hydratase